MGLREEEFHICLPPFFCLDSGYYTMLGTSLEITQRALEHQVSVEILLCFPIHYLTLICFTTSQLG